MKFIKLFEDYNKDEIVEKIKQVWGVDPHTFYDIILSSMNEYDIWGSLYVDFSVLYKNEFRPCFYLTESGLRNGPYSHNLDAVLEYKHLLVIETWLDVSEDIEVDAIWKLTNIIDRNFINFNIPYLLYCEGDNINNRLYFTFEKKDSK